MDKFRTAGFIFYGLAFLLILALFGLIFFSEIANAECVNKKEWMGYGITSVSDGIRQVVPVCEADQKVDAEMFVRDTKFFACYVSPNTTTERGKETKSFRVWCPVYTVVSKDPTE